MKNRIKKRQLYKLYQGRYIRLTAKDRAWLDMAPVGREFGSKDYERLVQLDALADVAKTAANQVSEFIDQTLQVVEESNNRIRDMGKGK